jgi:tetrathionate reductase subunit B
MKIVEHEKGTMPKVRVWYQHIMCQHCDNAPCIAAAKNGAIYKRSDGLVIIDPVKSVGQKQLVAACPYGAIYWNSALNIPQKCTGCAHIVDGNAGIPAAYPLNVPRCVDNCHTSAITFGEEADLQALISKAEVLHPEYGTKPRVYYLNLPKLFIAGTLYDPAADEIIQGATVTATDLATGNVYSTTTDSFGDFWFNDLLGGKTYELNITATGFFTKKMEVYLKDDKNVGDIPLFKGSA